MTLEEKKARLVELKAKLAQMKESASLDAERGGLQAAAERMMVDDPTGAFNLLDKSRALDIQQQKADKVSTRKDALMKESNTLTYAIKSTDDPDQKQMLVDRLKVVSNEYLKEVGAPVGKTTDEDARTWLAGYWKSIALPSYGVNADKTIRDKERLKTDIKSAARKAGYSVLDKEIDAMVEGHNKDLGASDAAERAKEEERLRLARDRASLSQTYIDNAYRTLDLKFPKLREEGIAKVKSAVSFVKAGNKGDASARNNLVKTISRLGSDEALTESDFGRALGRRLGDQFLSRIAGAITGAGLPITDAEWAKLKSFAKTYYEDMQRTIKEADPDGKLLQKLPAWPGDNVDMADGKPLVNPPAPVNKGKTGKATWEIVE